MIKFLKTHFIKRKVIVLTILVALILASSGFWFWNRLIRADIVNSGNTLEGYVYGIDQGVSTLGGRPLAEATVQIIGQKNTMFARTNLQGRYTQRLNDPVECVYKVVIYADGYNAKRVYWQSPSGSFLPGQNRLSVTLEKEIDATYSHYFNSTYFQGYEGGYKVSNWDTSYFRNPITMDKFNSPQSDNPWAVKAPDKAKIKLNIKNLSVSRYPNGPFMPWKVKLSAFAIQSVWESDISTVDSGKPVGFTEFTVDHELSGTSVEISLDLSNLSPAQRYYAYVNGFRITYSSSDSSSDSSESRWINFTRSEDGSPSTISYEGSGIYNDIPESGLRSCIVAEAKKHVPGKYILGADNGFNLDGTPKPVDCSGLVNTAYNKVGLKTGGSTDRNNTQTIWPYFKPIKKENLKPGDLVFKVPKSANWPYGHVGIYIGGNQVIEAKGSKFGVIYSSIDSWLAAARHPLFSLEDSEKTTISSSDSVVAHITSETVLDQAVLASSVATASTKLDQAVPASTQDTQAISSILNSKFKTSEFPVANSIKKFTIGTISVANGTARAEISPTFVVKTREFPADNAIIELKKVNGVWKITNIGTGI